MTPEFKVSWLEALRSGRYAQGAGALRTNDDKFCCLGVACDLLYPNNWELSAVSPHLYAMDGVDGYPNYSHVTAIGITFAAMGRLANMNDTQHKSFAKIADYIETNL